jgi:hypothetical protein
MAGAAVRRVTTSTPELTGRLRAASRPESELTPECETLTASQIFCTPRQMPLPSCWCYSGSTDWIVVLRYLNKLPPIPNRRPDGRRVGFAKLDSGLCAESSANARTLPQYASSR